MKKNTAMLPITWCQPLDAGMSSYRKFLIAVWMPVRCSNHSMICLCMGLERSDLETIAFHLHFEAIQRPRRRPGQHFSVNRKRRRVARADERVAGIVPMVRTPQVRALRRKCNHLVIRFLHHPRGGFFCGYLPTVYASPLKRNFLRRARRQTAEIARIHPLILFVGFGRK